MKNQIILSIVFAFLFIGCNNISTNEDTIQNKQDSAKEQQVVEEEVEFVEESFEDFANRFLGDISNCVDLYKYSNRKTLYAIDNPGAFSVLMFLEDSYSAQYIDLKTNMTLVEEPLPNFSCETESWSKEGAFWTSEISNHILVTMQNSIEYAGAEYSSESINEVNYYSSNTSYIIRCTDTGVTYYFEKNNDGYNLYCVDISTFCEA